MEKIITKLFWIYKGKKLDALAGLIDYIEHLSIQRSTKDIKEDRLEYLELLKKEIRGLGGNI